MQCKNVKKHPWKYERESYVNQFRAFFRCFFRGRGVLEASPYEIGLLAGESLLSGEISEGGFEGGGGCFGVGNG